MNETTEQTMRRKFEEYIMHEYPFEPTTHLKDSHWKTWQAAQASIATPQPQSVHVISDSHDVYIALSQAVAGQLIYIRDALAKGDITEAHHALYCIADPNLTSTEPWKRLEDIAAGKAIIEPLSADEHKEHQDKYHDLIALRASRKVMALNNEPVMPTSQLQARIQCIIYDAIKELP